MRIVLDTNILARAASPSRSPAREVLIRCIEDPHTLLLSAFIVWELSRVLRYDRVRSIHGLDEAGIERYIAHLESASVTVTLPTIAPKLVVSSDPEDDPILTTAVVGEADILCTLDRHFYHDTVLQYCRRYGVEVIDDVALLARLRESDG